MSLRDPDPRQTVQRVRVGLVGLAAVILLIGLAGMIFSALRRDQSPAEPGAPSQIAATETNAADASDPLADLGVAPGPAIADPASRERPPMEPGATEPTGTESLAVGNAAAS